MDADILNIKMSKELVTDTTGTIGWKFANQMAVANAQHIHDLIDDMQFDWKMRQWGYEQDQVDAWRRYEARDRE